MITHLEPDILECEVRWAIGYIIINKTSGVDGIPVELYQILQDDDFLIWGGRVWVKERTILIKVGNYKGLSFSYITTNKASGGDGIPVELFQILKDDAVKVLHTTHRSNRATVLVGRTAYPSYTRNLRSDHTRTGGRARIV